MKPLIFLLLLFSFLSFQQMLFAQVTPSPVSTTMTPEKVESDLSPAIKALLPENAERVHVLDADFLGDGQKETAVSYTVPSKKDKDSSDASLIVVSTEPGQSHKIIWKYEEDNVIYILPFGSALDVQNPKQSFLILYRAYGGVSGSLLVLRWDGKKFSGVESADEIWGPCNVGTMSDGRNVILVDVGVYGDEGPDIYKLEKGILIPCNYQYPEVYQAGIDEILKKFKSSDVRGRRILAQPCIRLLKKFLYGGRMKDGMYLYDELLKMFNGEAPYGGEGFDSFGETGIFRAYAYLEAGQKKAALDTLSEYFSSSDLSDYQLSRALGDYYYYKNDFKNALKYYLLADINFNSPKNQVKPNPNRKPTPDKRVKILQDLIRNE